MIADDVKTACGHTDKDSPPKPDYRFRVVSGHREMGELISRWTRDIQQRPQSLQELKDQARKAKVELEVGVDVTEVQFYPMPNNHRASIYLPPAELIDEDLPSGEYPLPRFYRDAFPCEDRIKDKEAFKMSRIGEYTTQKCY